MPRLTDQGDYIASESSFYRILRAEPMSNTTAAVAARHNRGASRRGW